MRGFLAAFLLVLSTPAHCEELPDWALSLTLGQAIVAGGEADLFADSTAFSLDYLRFAQPGWFGWGAELGSALSHKVKRGATAGSKMNQIWFTPIVRLGAQEEMTGADLRPYAIFGGGIYRQTMNAGERRAGSFLGVNLGGGFEVNLRESLQLAADVRYHYILDDANSLKYIFPGARITILF